MELQMNKQKLDYFDCVADKTAEELFSADAVVPDAMPDVGAVLLTEGDFFLWRLDLEEGSAEAEGELRTNVCYTAEDSGSMASFPVTLPIRLRVASDGISPGVRPYAVCRVTELSAQLMNSRKVRVRARVQMRLRTYRPGELLLTQGLETATPSVFLRQTPVRFTLPAAVEEQVFSAESSYTLRFPLADGRLLSSHSVVVTEEAKQMAGRVVVQGRVQTELMYITPDQDAPVTETMSTTFSQLIDANVPGEIMAVQTQLQLTSSDLTVRGDENTLQAVFHIVAQVVCLTEQNCSCVTDAYSVAAPLELTREPLRLARASMREPVVAYAEDTIACDTAGKTITGSRTVLRSVSSDRAGVSGAVEVHVLLRSSDGVPSSVRRELRFSLPSETQLSVLSAVPESASCTVGADGVMVRVPVQLGVMDVDQFETQQLSAIGTGEGDTPHAALPSITIVPVSDQPDLWELSKRWCSSEAAIRAANPALEGDEMPAFLLLPKIRA